MFKNISFIVFIALLLLALNGCAWTELTTFTDPAYKNTKFNKVMVMANTENLELRQRVEGKMVAAFTKNNILSIESSTVFPPTRNYQADKDKIRKLFAEFGIDAILIVNMGEKGVSEEYIPQTGSKTKTEGSVNVYGNTANYKQKSTTTYQGGYSMNKPWANFTVELHDASDAQTAWTGFAETDGNAYANFNTVYNSFCRETVDKLIKDKLVNIQIVKPKSR